MFDHNNFLVSPRSNSEIEKIAEKFREHLGFHDSDYFPAVELLELLLDNEVDEIELQIIEDEDAQEYDGATSTDGKIIYLRNSAYCGAYSGEYNARYTVAHELGHAMLHAEQTQQMARVRKHPNKTYCQSEAQADRFAEAVLVPLSKISKYDNVDTINKRFGVTQKIATKRMNEWKQKEKDGLEFDFEL